MAGGLGRTMKGSGCHAEAQARTPWGSSPHFPAGIPQWRAEWRMERCLWGECSLSQPRSQAFICVLPSPRADLPSLALWRECWGQGREVVGCWGPGEGGLPLLSPLIRWLSITRREETSCTLPPHAAPSNEQEGCLAEVPKTTASQFCTWKTWVLLTSVGPSVAEAGM